MGCIRAKVLKTPVICRLARKKGRTFSSFLLFLLGFLLLHQRSKGKMNRLFLLITIILLWGCAEQESASVDDFADCLYEAPTAIFSDQLPAIRQHRFKISSAKGIEHVVFDTGLELDIHQSGCELMQQNFFFKVEDGIQLDDHEQCIHQASEYFYFLGTLDEEFLPLYEWGRLIQKYAQRMSLNAPFEVFPGFAVTIKQYKKRNDILLEVVLAQV